MDRERIETMKVQLEDELKALIEQARREIAMREGAIAALTQLLTEDAAAPPSAADSAADSEEGA